MSVLRKVGAKLPRAWRVGFPKPGTTIEFTLNAQTSNV